MAQSILWGLLLASCLVVMIEAKTDEIKDFSIYTISPACKKHAQMVLTVRDNTTSAVVRNCTGKTKQQWAVYKEQEESTQSKTTVYRLVNLAYRINNITSNTFTAKKIKDDGYQLKCTKCQTCLAHHGELPVGEEPCDEKNPSQVFSFKKSRSGVNSCGGSSPTPAPLTTKGTDPKPPNPLPPNPLPSPTPFGG